MVRTNDASTKAYCNVLAMEKGLDPVGYAGGFDTAFALELPLPWQAAILLQPERLPPELVQLVQRYYSLPAEQRPAVRPLFIAPDAEYSKPGYRRLIHYSRPLGSFSRFDRVEYHAPEAEIGKIIWSLQQAPDDLTQFDTYRVDTSEMRDVLVCTHGSVDAACAKFGYPLYKSLRQSAGDNVRVWRVNHFGGHVFAPTLLDMPTGHYWAYVETEQGRQIIDRSGDVTALRGHYRGWAGLPRGFIQAAERELWQQYGWEWFDYLKSGEVVAQDEDDENPLWADVRLEYAANADSQAVEYYARVEVAHHIETISSTGRAETYGYPQYVVTQLKQSRELRRMYTP